MPYARVNDGPQRTSTGLYQITYHPIKGLAIRKPSGGLTGEYFGYNNPEHHAEAERVCNLYNSGGPEAVMKDKQERTRTAALTRQLGGEPTPEQMDHFQTVSRAASEARTTMNSAQDAMVIGNNSAAHAHLLYIQGIIERLLEMASEPDIWQPPTEEGGGDHGTNDTASGIFDLNPADAGAGRD